MSKSDKLLTKAKSNPGSLTFKELENLLVRYGWKKIRKNHGSHQQWATPDRKRVVPMKNFKGTAAKYQVENFFKFTEI